jgi:hypothetical protein
MEQEAWPTPQTPAREPLPRVEDLPVAEQGYEQESVKAAFDSFYRHAAQIDAALRTLEAVDSFHRHASALRSDLRTLRSAGWTQQSWSGPPSSYGYDLRAPREGVPPVVWRVGGEVAFLIAVAVGLGLASLSWWAILLAMAGALLIVCAIEWVAGRDELNFAQPAAAPVHPVVEAQRSEDTEEHDALGWTAFEEAQEPSDAMTMIGALPREEAEAPVGESAPAEPEDDPGSDDDSEPDLPPAAEELVPEQDGRRRWWRRRSEESKDAPLIVAGPRHVRVLQNDDDDDPWEQGFDAPVTAEAEEVREDEADADEPELVDEDGRGLFRRG